MPIQEAIAMVLVMSILSIGAFATINLFLSHRREMAQIKQGRPAIDSENAELRETVGMLQDRLAVLEQIATDPAQRTAEEIEKLR